MSFKQDTNKLRVALPKGRMFTDLVELLKEADIHITSNDRSYRPRCSDPMLEIKILKPQNIPRLVELGAHDVGFTGHDWVVETGSKVNENMDTGLDPVRIVAAVPRLKVEQFKKREGSWVVASEYETITRKFLDEQRFKYIYVRSFGSTEVFPPEDADMIIDNCATGLTLEQNGLVIVNELFTSSTRLISNKKLSKTKQQKVDDLITLLQSVLSARKRVLLEMNVPQNCLDSIVNVLPAMRSPTVQKLHGEDGYAVKAAVPKTDLVTLIPRLLSLGATDILQIELKKVLT